MMTPRRASIKKINLYKCLICFLIFLPCLSWLESIVRSGRHLYLFQDYIAPAFFWLFSMSLINMTQLGKPLGAAFLVVFAIYYFTLLLVHPRTNRTHWRRPVAFLVAYIDLLLISSWLIVVLFLVGFSDAFQLFNSLAFLGIFYLLLVSDFHPPSQNPFLRPMRYVLTVVDLMAIEFLLIGACWRPVVVAPLLAGALMLCFLYAKRRKRPLWTARLVWLMGAVASGAFVAQHFLLLHDAAYVPAVHLYDRAAYDALIDDNGDPLVLTRNQGAQYFTAGAWRSIVDTRVPQRLTVDHEARAVYIANYNSKDQQVVTRFQNRRVSHYDLTDCWRAIDIAFIPKNNRLLVACEKTHNLFLFTPGLDDSPTILALPFVPYAIAVDHHRKRALVTTQIGLLYLIDLETEQIVTSKFVGLSWGICVDEVTGNTFIAKFSAGEVLVLDERLAVIRRIPVGYAPRDLAIDQETGTLLVGNYLTGTVHVLDARTLEKIRQLQVGKSSWYNRLRGVERGTKGEWFVSDRKGVWLINRLFESSS